MWHNRGTGNVQITKKNNNKLNWRKRIVRGYTRGKTTHSGYYFHQGRG